MSAGDLVVAMDGICFGMLLFTVAAGLALTFGVAGVLNLSHGVFYVAGSYLGWTLTDASWSGLAAAVGVAAAGGSVAGAGLSVLLRPLTTHLDQALATIGVTLIGGYTLTRVYGADPLSVRPPAGLAGSVSLAGRDYPSYRLAFIAIAVVLAAFLWWTVSRTRAGLLIRAAAEDPGMLAALCVEPARVHTAVLAAGTALATTTGVLGAPILGAAPGLEHTILISSLIIVVAAGGRSIPAIAGTALIVGQIDTTVVAAWPDGAPYLPHAILIAALLTRARSMRRRAGAA